MELDTSGKRILYTRNLASLTRSNFCKKYNIPIITLRSWESSINIKLKAAQRFSIAINKEDIYCDPIWIRSGLGHAPHMIINNASRIHKNVGSYIDEHIIKEIEYLEKHYKNTIHQLVVDNSMIPLLHPGDYVIGRYTTNPAEYIGYPSIVEIVNGQKIIRIIHQVNDKTKYKLVSLNSVLSCELILFKQEIKKIAKIFWIRKR